MHLKKLIIKNTFMDRKALLETRIKLLNQLQVTSEELSYSYRDDETLHHVFMGLFLAVRSTLEGATEALHKEYPDAVVVLETAGLQPEGEQVSGVITDTGATIQL